MRVSNNSNVQRTISLPASMDNVPTPPIRMAANGGAVEVEASVWDAVKDKPVVIAWLAEGIIATGKAPTKSAPPAQAALVQSDADEGPTVDMIASPDIASQMEAEGMTVATVALAKPGDLTHLERVGPAVAKKLIEAAQAALG